MRIALFGGSFDPPHLGHVLAAAYAYAIGGVDRLWVLPSARHPYAKPMSPWTQRWALCEAAFARFAFVALRDDEQANTTGFTFDLVAALRAKHPAARFALVGGTDTQRDLANWHRGAELARLVDVIAVPRRGYDDAHPAALPAISSTLVRTRIARGEAIGDLVAPEVAALIDANGWYR